MRIYSCSLERKSAKQLFIFLFGHSHYGELIANVPSLGTVWLSIFMTVPSCKQMSCSISI